MVEIVMGVAKIYLRRLGWICGLQWRQVMGVPIYHGPLIVCGGFLNIFRITDPMPMRLAQIDRIEAYAYYAGLFLDLSD